MLAYLKYPWQVQETSCFALNIHTYFKTLITCHQNDISGSIFALMVAQEEEKEADEKKEEEEEEEEKEKELFSLLLVNVLIFY